MKKVHIKTYGCQMNVYDSARMADVLAPQGFEATADLHEADLILLNTCHIREKAAEKVFSELGRLNILKKQRAEDGADLVIGVGGCVAQAEGVEIMRRAPYVELVFGPQTTHRLPEMVARAFRSRDERSKSTDQIVETEFEPEAKFDELPKPARNRVRSSAFLTIQEGCDKFCTFCVVPYTRGAEFSRSPQSIIEEAEYLVEAGARELNLLGQNVNAYRSNNVGLASLIGQLSKIPQLQRIRYTTSHPRDMDDDLIRAHGDNEALMPYLHLPVQSGSDKILQAMNRGHGRERYLDIIGQLRQARPDIALSSDFIVGFPGETDADFDKTMDLVRQVVFAQAYSFKFSPRPGTPASELTDQVPEDVKDARLAELQGLLVDQQKAFNSDHVGRSIEVLFEGAGRQHGQWIGRSPYYQSVHVPAAENLAGEVKKVQLTALKSHSLEGRLVDSAPPQEVSA